MRITKNIDFIQYFIDGHREQKSCNHLYIEGDKLYNYSTVLLEEVGDSFVFNETKYSVTTSKLQTYIRRCLENNRSKYVSVNNILINTQSLIGR